MTGGNMTTVERAACVARWWADRLAANHDDKRDTLREAIGVLVFDALQARPADLMIEVDYEPDELLQAALLIAGIEWSHYALPHKSHTMLWLDGTIEAKQGYGANLENITLDVLRRQS